MGTRIFLAKKLLKFFLHSRISTRALFFVSFIKTKLKWQIAHRSKFRSHGNHACVNCAHTHTHIYGMTFRLDAFVEFLILITAILFCFIFKLLTTYLFICLFACMFHTKNS